MKTKIALSLIAGSVLFGGCAITGAGISKKEMVNKNVKDVLVLRKKYNHILADNSKNTLFTSYGVGTLGTNLSSAGFGDIFNTRDFLKDYCEANSGKWTDGKRYSILASRDMIRGITTIGKTYNNSGLGVCNLPNGNGFKVKELGIFDYKTDWIIPNNMGGGGKRGSWHNYYEIVYDKPQVSNKNYLTLSNSNYKEDYKNANDVIKNYNGKSNAGADNYYLAQLNTICKNFGGTAYIMTDKMDNKKMPLNNYMMKKFDELFDKYKDKVESFSYSYRLFPINKKGAIWCQNTTNPDNQFMLIWQSDTNSFKAIKGYNASLLPNKEVNNNFNKTEDTEKITTTKTSPDRSAANLAKGIFTMKSDISVDNNPFVKYFGYYIGKFGACEYASVDKKERNMDYIYNFKKCGNGLEYAGQTLKKLTQAEYNRFTPYFNILKENCKINGKAIVNVNGYNLYCKSNSNGSAMKFFMLDNQYRLIDVK
jgi:hypothetical protein